VHLVEDLHMPLHVADNGKRGGNDMQVRFSDRGSNMHRVWDSGIIDHAGRGEDGWLADLIAVDTDEARRETKTGSVVDWVTASLLAAREPYQGPGAGRRIKPGAERGDDYQARSLPVAKRRLHQAGARLVWVLNETLGDGSRPEAVRPRQPPLDL
jgi:hypothetical protein